MIESGYPGFVSMSWTGIVAPVGTPPEIVAKINRAVVDSFRSKEAAESLARLGAEPNFGTPESFGTTIAPRSPNGRRSCAPQASGATDDKVRRPRARQPSQAASLSVTRL
jgi:hypothetical protein